MLFINNRKVQPAFTMACPCLKYYYYILGHKQVFFGIIFQTWCKCYFTPTAVRKAATELSHSMFGHAYSKRYSSDLVLFFHKAAVRDRLKKKIKIKAAEAEICWLLAPELLDAAYDNPD